MIIYNNIYRIGIYIIIIIIAIALSTSSIHAFTITPLISIPNIYRQSDYSPPGPLLSPTTSSNSRSRSPTNKLQGEKG